MSDDNKGLIDLRLVVEVLRQHGRFDDEEGEVTNNLQDLIDSLSTPPAVMPAAPSEIELQHREALDCLDSVMRAASHVLVGLAPSEKEAKLRSVLSKAHDWCMAERAALSQTMQPQAEPLAPVPYDKHEAEILAVIDERDRYHDMADQLAAQIAAITGDEIGEHSSDNDPWRNAMLAADEWIARDLRAMFAGESEPRSRRAQAEPAAGEQAGAVARTELQAACFRWLLENCISEDGNGWLRIGYSTARQGDGHKDWAHWLTVDVAGEMGMEVDDLAAPGAAIAAREQEAEVVLTIAQISQLTGRKMLDLFREAAKYGVTVETANRPFDALPFLCALASPKEAQATPQAALSALQIADCVTAVRPYSVALATVPAEELIAFVRNIEAALTQPTTVQQADVEAHRQQIASLILGDDLRVSSLLESTPGFGGDIEHRFQISNDTERYGVVIIVTALKGMQPGERKEGA